MLSKPVAAGIRQPQELIQNILDGKAEVFHAENAGAAQESSEKLSLGGAFYKHLMSGVSQMLPFVIGGGIMIALAFLLDQIMGVPKDQLSQLGSYHEIAAQFKAIGGAAFGFMLPVLAGYIAYSIAEKPGLVSGFVAGAIASSGATFGGVPFGSGGKANPCPCWCIFRFPWSSCWWFPCRWCYPCSSQSSWQVFHVLWKESDLSCSYHLLVYLLQVS